MTEEITPEGMSSEDVDALTVGEDAPKEDADDATEALAAVDEAEVDPKDAVIGDFRRKARDLEIENAKLSGQLEARKELQVKQDEATPEKSPLELAEAAYTEENGDLDGFAMTGALYREQKAFDDANAKAEADTVNSSKAATTMERAAEDLQEGDLSPETMGEGLDLRTIARVGDKHLTRGDNLDLADVQASKGTGAALKEAYSIMKRRILAAGGDDAKALKAAIAAKKGVSQQKPKLDVDALITEGGDIDAGDADAPHSERLTNFMFS